MEIEHGLEELQAGRPTSRGIADGAQTRIEKLTVIGMMGRAQQHSSSTIRWKFLLLGVGRSLRKTDNTTQGAAMFIYEIVDQKKKDRSGRQKSKRQTAMP